MYYYWVDFLQRWLNGTTGRVWRVDRENKWGKGNNKNLAFYSLSESHMSADACREVTFDMSDRNLKGWDWPLVLRADMPNRSKAFKLCVCVCAFFLFMQLKRVWPCLSVIMSQRVLLTGIISAQKFSLTPNPPLPEPPPVYTTNWPLSWKEITINA